jgi:hypothetical protein
MLSRPLRVLLSTGALAIGLHALPAVAAPMPSPDVLRVALGMAPARVDVYEPHLSTPERPVVVTYLGYPVTAVLKAVLGQAWTAQAHDDLEFRAADGYVSRISRARLARYRAWIVVARADGLPFSVTNLSQQEGNVPLGPFYLVWDNRTHRELLAEEGTHWPYQVVDVSLVPSADQVLVPGAMKSRYGDIAAKAQDMCLTCHQVNGFGGTKYPINLADRAKQMTASAFVAWVLDPRALKPATTMSAITRLIPESERRSLAQQLYDYFVALPVRAR